MTHSNAVLNVINENEAMGIPVARLRSQFLFYTIKVVANSFYPCLQQIKSNKPTAK